MIGRFAKRLRKKAKKGSRGGPIATIAYYGPTDQRASKVVVSIVLTAYSDIHKVRKWFSDTSDLRNDETIAEEILAFLTEEAVISVVMPDRIIGCPHEETVDYEGQWCPVCDFWKGRDRFTGKLIPQDGE